MQPFHLPEPVLDEREERLLKTVTAEYEEFVTPGAVSRNVQKLRAKAKKALPESVASKAEEIKGRFSELELMKKALEKAGKGFAEITKQAARFTVDPEKVVSELRDAGVSLDRYQHVQAVRSYQVQPLVSDDLKERVMAFLEGAATGALGFPGIVPNIALSFFLYFRATQNVALYYGYDVRNDPREMEIASEVTMQSLSPSKEESAGTLSGFLGKMMMAAEVSALRKSLKQATYEQMARKGGAELVYVQIRALANKAAKKALDRAGQEGIEAGIFRKMLQQLGEQMPKRVGQRAVPILGGLIGGAFDTYYMGKVLQGANLIYHKRFLIEKEERVRILRDHLQDIKNYDAYK